VGTDPPYVFDPKQYAELAERRRTRREIEGTGQDRRRASDEITEAVGGHAPDGPMG
jgi:hypothetical protein